MELWDYVVRRASPLVQPVEGQGSRVSAFTIGGMTRQSKSLKSTTYLLRFETEAQLSLLRSIFGDTVTCGIRRRRPKVGMSKFLRENDDLNVVVGSEEAETPFKKRTVQQGVDLRYDNRCIAVAIRYQKYQYTVDANGYPIDCPTAHLSTVIADGVGDEVDDGSSTSSFPTLTIGAYFEWQDRIVKVRLLRPSLQGGQQVFVTALDGPQDQRGPLPHPIDDSELVADLIAEYNGH